MLPVVSGLIGGVLDWKIAKKMTRIVGTMCCAYYQRNGEWKNGLKASLKEAKQHASPLDIAKTSDYPDIHERHIENLIAMIKVAWRFGANKESIYNTLLANAPKEWVDIAMRVFGERTGWNPAT